ncbi:MAG: hypothetical protein IKW95_08040 [Lachnospiraceae bacterium]|nr:hypothetical protein [Lachnospiraceae bacterium]
MKKRIMALLLLVCLVLSGLSNSRTARADDDWYTYTYNYWGDEAASPDAYTVDRVISGSAFGEEVGSLSNPDSLFAIDDLLYVVDSKNNRIIEAQWKNGEFRTVREIYHVNVSEEKKDLLMIDGKVELCLLQPGDVFVKPITKEQREKVFGEYLGTPYVPEIEPEEEEKGEEGGDTDADKADGENTDAEKSDSSSDSDGEAGDGETADAGEAGETGETGEAGEGSESSESGKKSKTKWHENVVVRKFNRDYDIYIADTQNFRIIHCDYDLNVIDVIQNPKDETLADDYKFLPSHFVVDDSYRCYVQAQNINAGIMEFTKDGTFNGYIGASPVTISFAQRIWRRIQTKEQRQKTKQFVPTEYNNICIDSKGFLYVTTSTLKDNEIQTGTGKPVRKLNSMGTDILIRNGNHFPIGDLKTGNVAAAMEQGLSITGPSAFVDVVTFENETYCCLDKTRGRLFVYDFQGNLLYAFGNSGMNEGSFLNPSAVVKLDEETLAVLDRFAGTITIFTMTSYGKLINKALSLYRVGEYDKSADVWRDVLKYNGNCELAYVGIGRSLLRQKRYKEAMDQFEIARDSVNYSKAFKYYREEVVEDNIVWFIVIIAALILIPKGIKTAKRLRKEISEA